MFHAKIKLDKDYRISRIDNRIFSSFLEHFGRAIYGGIYEPGHITADPCGYRTDVLPMVKDLNLSLVRYPGGNYVSGYNWEDSVGPKESRPERLDLSWFTTESNQFGLHEFIDWCEKSRTTPMMCINLGTRGVADAKNIIEYTNHPGGSYYSDLRKKNGREKPMDIKMWCLGNEMDGPWQIGHKTAYEYGKIANEAGKVMKWVDPSIELIACGSSNRQISTFAEWERVVLEECYDTVDYISLHQYYWPTEHGTEDFLARSIDMEEFIHDVISICDCVKAKKRSKKRVNLSFDEWNVWYHSKAHDDEIMYGTARWGHALPLCEDIYSFKDALLSASMLMTIMRNSDRVKIACISQLVNVLAPIMTRTGGGCWKQTIYYPFFHMSKYGRGTALQSIIDSPKYSCHDYDDVAYIDALAVLGDYGEVTVFCVNRNMNEDALLEIDLRSFGSLNFSKHIVYFSENIEACNTEENPDYVVPSEENDVSIRNGFALAPLKKASWNVIRFEAINAD